MEKFDWVIKINVTNEDRWTLCASRGHPKVTTLYSIMVQYTQCASNHEEISDTPQTGNNSTKEKEGWLAGFFKHGCITKDRERLCEDCSRLNMTKKTWPVTQCPTPLWNWTGGKGCYKGDYGPNDSRVEDEKYCIYVQFTKVHNRTVIILENTPILGRYTRKYLGGQGHVCNLLSKILRKNHFM